MTTVALCPIPKAQFFDSNGDPLSGGLLYTYVTGTTTNKATYTDATGNSANANPVVLDSRGEADVWLLTDANYKFVLKTSAGTTVWTVNNFGFASPTFQTATVTGNLTVNGSIIAPTASPWLCFAITGETETVASGTSKYIVRLPACTVIAVRSSVKTASSSGLVTVDINDDTVSIFTTTLSIDANEKTSVTAATPAVILNPTIGDDSEMTFDVDAAGTGAVGLKVYMQVRWG